MKNIDKYLFQALDNYPYWLEGTIESLDYALSYDDKNTTALCLYGRIHAEQLQDYEGAKNYFQQAISIDIHALEVYPYYIETLLSHEAYIKEVKLFGFAPLLLQRYRDTFARLYAEDRRLTLRRDGWGFGLGLLGTAAFYAAYAWVVIDAVHGQISLGQMTMYVLLFRQGQSAVSASLAAISGMYEDNLYLSTLYDYLDTPVDAASGTATAGPRRPPVNRFWNHVP